MAKHKDGHYIWALLRIGLAIIFLWAFFDKVFGLGFATQDGKAWIDGVSPTYGFLKNAPSGPLKTFYNGLATNVFVEWLFMMGLLGIGIALLTGAGMKIASYSGIIFMLLIFAASWPPKNNPILDEHIIYVLLLLLLSQMKAGQWFGIGKWWSRTSLVKKYKFLE